MNNPHLRRSFHSLTWRVILTVFGAFGLVWLGLMAFEFGHTRLAEADNNPALTHSVIGLRDVLAGIEDPQLAANAVQAIDRMGQSERRQQHVDVDVFTQVRDRRDGKIVFRSPSDLQLDHLQTGHSRRMIAGTLYYIDSQQDGRWEITVGQMKIPTSWLLKELNAEMMIDIFIACPLLLVPVWLAVRFGLRPLRNLANNISARDPDDLSPVKITQRHAELNLLADAFNLQLAKVARLIARERAFVQDAAHELRTPMAVIAVNAHAVANARTTEERAAAEARLNSGLSRTSHLVEQLLVLARLDVRRRNEMELCDVVPLVRDDIAAAVPAAVAKNIDLALEAPDALNRCVESHALHSIVGNLVDNAIRYGRNGGRVVVTLTDSGEDWALSVADDGVGIPAAGRARVFERFYRGDHDEVSGTGLGLAIVRAAAGRLDGTVHVTDGLDGRGCTFTVQFSVRSAPLEAHPERTDVTSAATPVVRLAE